MSEEEILDKYEKTIFNYLANNCSEFDDEHIKHLVDSKVEQYNQLKSQLQQKESIIKEARKYIEDKWRRDYYYEDIDNCTKFCVFSEFEYDDFLEILDKEIK